MRTLRQVVEVIHPGLAGVSKKDLQEKLCKMYKVRQRQAATSPPYATHPSTSRRTLAPCAGGCSLQCVWAVV